MVVLAEKRKKMRFFNIGALKKQALEMLCVISSVL